MCQRHQTILRLLSSAATASTRWRVRELYCGADEITFKLNISHFTYTAQNRTKSHLLRLLRYC